MLKPKFGKGRIKCFFGSKTNMQLRPACVMLRMFHCQKCEQKANLALNSGERQAARILFS